MTNAVTEESRFAETHARLRVPLERWLIRRKELVSKPSLTGVVGV